MKKNKYQSYGEGVVQWGLSNSVIKAFHYLIWKGDFFSKQNKVKLGMINAQLTPSGSIKKKIFKGRTLGMISFIDTF